MYEHQSSGRNLAEPPRMSFLNTVRFLFVLVSTVFAWVIGTELQPAAELRDYAVWALGGLAVSALLVFIEVQIRRAYPKELIVGVIGLVAGLVTANLIANAIPLELLGASVNQTHYAIIQFALHIFFGYFGLVMALRFASRLDVAGSKLIPFEDEDLAYAKVLDTSVLIDGRIADVIQTGIVEGTLVIPQFVLTELQAIADSQDELRRTRGRRGLDVVRRLQAMDCPLIVDQRDFPGEVAVDAKLVLLARRLNGKIISNDFNLNQVAEIQQVDVVNVNELANAMKQVVLPGEALDVYLVKEGRESGQGVGYLDDGTMVVVDNGINYLHQGLHCEVTSVLQTSAGRMVFARPADSDKNVTPLHRSGSDGNNAGRKPRHS